MPYVKTRFNGVYYRESKKKLYNGKPDRCFYIRYYQNNQQIEQKIGWQSEGYSLQTVAQKRIEYLNVTPVCDNLTYDEAFVIFLDWAMVNKKSWKNDKERYELHIKPAFGNTYLKDIKSSDINNLMVYLKKYIRPNGKKYAPQTIKHYFNDMRRLFNFIKALDRYRGENPAASSKIQLERFDNSRLSYLSDDEVFRILEICDNSSLLNVYDGAFIKFAIFTGFRRSELFALTWDKVDLDKGIIYLTETKGKKNQTIILTDLALAVLRSLTKVEVEPYVFPSIKGGKRNDIKKLWQRVKTYANVREDVRFHDVRHTFGTVAVSNGVPLDVLQKMMTHKDIKTTQRYAHIVDKRLKEGAEAINAAFKSLDSGK